MEQVVIIGSGPAGLTAAIYLARAGLPPVVICGNKPGGQLINTDLIENYPGFESINGADLMMRFIAQAEKFGARLFYESVKNVEKIDFGFRIQLESEEFFESMTVLVATGAAHRHLAVPGEIEFTNKGVSWCATCDGPLYRENVVAVVGGGNTAVMDALYLSPIAEKVYLVHRRDKLRAERVLQERLFERHNVECIWNSEVVEILGDTSLRSIGLNNGRILDVSALFIAVGVVPSSGFVSDLVALDGSGYIIANETKTSVPGVFAAGDVVSGSLKQAVFAAGQGCLAAQSIGQYLGAV